MKKYRVDITPTAENDLTKRFKQIEKDSPHNAVSWYINLVEAIEKLDVWAERCPIAPEDIDMQKGIRHLIIGDYRVLYAIHDYVVQVLHVRHGGHDRKL